MVVVSFRDSKVTICGPAIFAHEPIRKMIKNQCFFVNTKDTWIFMKMTQNPRVLGVYEKHGFLTENFQNFKSDHFEQFRSQF